MRAHERKDKLAKAPLPRPRTRRALELVFLFILLPLALAYIGEHARRFVLPQIFIISALCFVLLRRDPTFDMRALWAMPHPLRPHGLRLGLLLLAGGLLLAVLLPWLPFPLAPFALPREQPSLWLAAILLYPLLSAFPQEFIFRVFFFHRYQALGLRPSRMIAASAMSFALAHAQFGNWPAVALSFLGGLLFAYTYARTRSWLLVGAEHGLWGDWLLTLGFAPYFYGGFI